MRERVKRFGLTIRPGEDFEVVDTHQNDPRYRDYVASYLEVAERKGVTPSVARTVVRTSPTVIGALALHRGAADALICGLAGRRTSRLKHIRDIVGLAPGVKNLSAMSLVIASAGVFFLADTHVQYDPTAEQISDMAIACAHHVRRFGLTRVMADALPVGPILIGPAKPAHVLTPSVTARGIVNMTAIAAVEAAGG